VPPGCQIELEKITTFQFFERIQKYLRSIGYYGDSPFLLCNYGSSEYAQAFSRIGSLHGCIYIVNDDLKLGKMTFDEKGQFKNISMSFSKIVVVSLIGFYFLDTTPEYYKWA
jgi:RAB protein geranylgeranyltransferase component A